MGIPCDSQILRNSSIVPQTWTRIHLLEDTLKKLIITLFLSAIAILSFTQDAFAQSRQSSQQTNTANNPEFQTQAVYKKRFVPKAFSFVLTPSGLEKVGNNVLSILSTQGMRLEEAYFGPYSYQAPKAISIEELEKQNQNLAQTIRKVREALAKYLIGFTLNDHQPQFKLGDTGYIASLKKFAIIADQDLMNKLKKNDGAIFRISLEISDLTLVAESLRISDHLNPQLGELGFDKISLSLLPESPSLLLDIPLFVRIDENQLPRFENLGVSTNIKDVRFNLAYNKFVMPEINVSINGKTYPLNIGAIDSDIRNSAPSLLTKVNEKLDNFVHNELPNLLNEKISTMVTSRLEQTNFFPVPGAEPTDTRPPFLWGARLEKLHLNNSLKAEVGAFLEDSWKNDIELSSKNAARGPVRFGWVRTEEYDGALAVDRAFANRLLQLLYDRGILEKPCRPESPALKFAEAPQLDVATAVNSKSSNDPNVTYLTLWFNTVQEASSFQRMVLRKTFNVGIQAIIKVAFHPKTKQLKLTLDRFNYDSISLPKKYLTGLGALLEKRIMKAVRERFQDLEKTWRTPQQCTNGTYENELGEFTLNAPLDLPIKLKAIKTDPNGHLIVYTKFGDAK